MDFKSWKRKNVTLRGVSTDIRTENSAGARFGNGLYTAALSNRKMASGYGNVYYVVGAIPKNPKIFNDANQAEIWVQRFVYDWMKKHLNIDDRLDSREFYKKTDLATEMIKAGFDGIIIKGREMVNYKPDEDEVKYFSNDRQLEDYFERRILNESMNQDFVGHFEKGDKFMTPSGLIEIKSKVKENNKHGYGYKVGSVIIPFDEFESNVEKGLWTKIPSDPKLNESQINDIANKLLEMEDKPKYAGLRKKSNDIDKALKAELSKANYNKKLADKKKEEYYRKLKNKNIKESEEKSYLPLFKNGKSILDYNYAYKNEYFVDLDKLEGYTRKVIQTYLRKSENDKLFVLGVTKSLDIIYAEVSYTKNPKLVQESTLIPFDCLYESVIEETKNNLLESNKFEQKYVDMFLLEQKIIERYNKNPNYLNTNTFLTDRNRWEKMMKKHRGWSNSIFELGDHGSTNKEWIDFCDENGLDWKYNMDDVLA